MSVDVKLLARKTVSKCIESRRSSVHIFLKKIHVVNDSFVSFFVFLTFYVGLFYV